VSGLMRAGGRLSGLNDEIEHGLANHGESTTFMYSGLQIIIGHSSVKM